MSHLPSTGTHYRNYETLDHNCGEILPPLHPYGAIAVFGAGTFTDVRGVEQPNDFQEGRLKTAAQLFVAGYSNQVVLIDGGDGEVTKTSLIIIKKYVKQFSGGSVEFKSKNLVIVSDSVNTAENMKDLKEYMQEQGIKTVLGVSDIFHYERLGLLRQSRGVNMDFAPTECVAEKYFPEDLPVLEKRNESDEMYIMLSKENLAILELNLIDKTGDLTIKWKRFISEADN